MRAALFSGGAFAAASAAAYAAAAALVVVAVVMRGGLRQPLRPLRSVRAVDLGEGADIFRVPSGEDAAPFLPTKQSEPPKYAEGGEFVPRPLALVERARHQRTLSQLSEKP
jgi:HAMP domain-containing protein